MVEIAASEAKTHFLRLLDRVAEGESIVVTRRGQRIARLVPEAQQRQVESKAAMGRIRERRAGAPSVSVEEILSSIREGRM
ncbi:MAG: type II toxin-antitoxin system Phd/YefM family antitoxin [Terriglobales bacterium]